MSTRTDTKQWVSDALVSGSAAAVLSAAALTLRSRTDEGSWAGGLNGPSQWLWGEQQARTRRATLRNTALGYAIHHGTSVFWALIFERACGRTNANRLAHLSPARIVAEAAGMTAAAYVVDYGLTPKRFQPGFEKHIRPGSMWLVYGAFAAGLAATNLWRRRQSTKP
jgi:hypothetical protein